MASMADTVQKAHRNPMAPILVMALCKDCFHIDRHVVDQTPGQGAMMTFRPLPEGISFAPNHPPRSGSRNI